MYAVYILFSSRCGKTYVGFTSNLIQRFYSHNFLGNKGWTMKCRPWEVILVEIYEVKKEALKREQFLKSGQGRLYIKKEILNR
jgi:putative endonuclease